MTPPLYLVTGGAGFIGSHLTDALLAAGHRVRVLDDLSTGKRANLDPAVELVVGDVSDPAAVRAAFDGVAGCFHLAAIASVQRCNEDWLGTHRVNLGGTIAVLDAARAAGRVPVVYASSAAVYGALSGVASEESPTVPLSAYGADKLGSEQHARAGFVVHGIPSVGLRFFNVFGPRQDPASPYSGVISLFAAALVGRRGLTVHGDGLQTRDFIYVADIVAFLMASMRLAAERPGCTVLNACTGGQTSIRGLAHDLAELLQVQPDIATSAPRAGDVRHSQGSTALAETMLGLRAKTPLLAGLERTLASISSPERV
ncbi:MAG: NAD-dependent epimerase/dehydratase family protein [Janthinobacterium lividum]